MNSENISIYNKFDDEITLISTYVIFLYVDVTKLKVINDVVDDIIKKLTNIKNKENVLISIGFSTKQNIYKLDENHIPSDELEINVQCNIAKLINEGFRVELNTSHSVRTFEQTLFRKCIENNHKQYDQFIILNTQTIISPYLFSALESIRLSSMEKTNKYMVTFDTKYFSDETTNSVRPEVIMLNINDTHDEYYSHIPKMPFVITSELIKSGVTIPYGMLDSDLYRMCHNIAKTNMSEAFLEYHVPNISFILAEESYDYIKDTNEELKKLIAEYSNINVINFINPSQQKFYTYDDVIQKMKENILNEDNCISN